MKKYLSILVLLFIGQATANAPKTITVQQNLSTKVSFTLPEINFPQTCTTQDEKCSFKPYSQEIIKIGNSTYTISNIYTSDYENGMTWDLIQNQKRTVSIVLQEVQTKQEYTLWINWSKIAPCLVGKTYSRDSKLKCLVIDEY